MQIEVGVTVTLRATGVLSYEAVATFNSTTAVAGSTVTFSVDGVPVGSSVAALDPATGKESAVYAVGVLQCGALVLVEVVNTIAFGKVPFFSLVLCFNNSNVDLSLCSMHSSVGLTILQPWFKRGRIVVFSLF
jgi:hypothetical protein